MSTRTSRITTAEQLLRESAGLGPCELVRGELIMMSPGKGRHAAVALRIGRALLNFVEARSLGEVFDSSAGYVLSRGPDTVREPDVSFLRAERLKHQDLDAFLEGAPDLAVEVLSPANTPEEMRAKINDYFAAGCRVCWIVDPSNRTVAVHRPDRSPIRLGADDSLTEEELLPGFSMPVGAMFPKI